MLGPEARIISIQTTLYIFNVYDQLHNILCLCFSVKDDLCKYIVPILLGMARAIGRSSDEDSALISQLFAPTKYMTPEVSDDEKDERAKSFTSFRPILPRTLSSHMITPETPMTPSGLSSSSDYFESHRERSPSPKPLNSLRSKTSPVKEPTPDLRKIYFNVWGSSFTKVKPWGFEIIPEQDHLKFSQKHLEKLFEIVSICQNTGIRKKIIHCLVYITDQSINLY